MALTDKQRRFVDAKARGASNKEAAMAADCAASTASAAGSRWAKNPEIQAAIAALQKSFDVKSKGGGKKAKATHEIPAEADLEQDDNPGSALPFTNDPLVWLLALMNESEAELQDRRLAAQAALPYVHGKKADQGKKEQKAEAAKEAVKGRFGTRPAPKLVVSNKG